MYCEVLGLKTEYERRGEGRPILILHGWGSSIQAMAPVANCVAALGYEAVSLAFKEPRWNLIVTAYCCLLD